METGALPPGTPPSDALEGSIPETLAMVRENHRVTEALGLHLVAYEGGPHNVSITGDSVANRLCHDTVNDPRMADLMTELLDGAR